MPRERTTVEQDAFGDWRVQAVTTLTEDALIQGAPPLRAGDLVYLNTTAKIGKDSFDFCTPSSTALALNVAFEAGERAQAVRDSIILKAPDQGSRLPRKYVGINELATLYEFFEQAMIAVTFSYQALETFCNLTIGWKLKGTMSLERRKREEIFTAAEMERYVSTEEKLATVLPQVLVKASPKGRREWQRFVKLRDMRDATIHLKADDQYPPEGLLEEGRLFGDFLGYDAREFPKTALAMIWYFRVAGESPARWRFRSMEPPKAVHRVRSNPGELVSSLSPSTSGHHPFI